MLKTLFFTFWMLLHPVHVTLTSIEYFPEMNCFKVFLRMYFDDFLEDYKLLNKDIEKKDFSGNNTTSRDVMGEYLQKKLILKVNGHQINGKLTNLVLEDNEISMNLEYLTRRKPESFTVKSLILAELYSDQSNMVIIRINNFEEGIKLTTLLTEKTFRIK